MTADDADRFERERLEADLAYNNALTALDRVVVAAIGQPALARADLERLATSLLVYLQHITAFVESKDREVAALTGARVDEVERALESLSEMRTQVRVLQRGVQMLTRSQGAAAPAPSEAPRPPALDDYKYVGFEDQFRGSDEELQERLRAYVPIFATGSTVLDLGCGRGEFLSLLKAAGIGGRGIDVNAEMVAAARERGLEAVQADALTYVTALPDDSLGGLIATQVVEHLEPAYLMRLLDTLSHKLRPGAPVVIETINPACWLAFFSSYIRDFTHVRPVHPETLQYLLRASGFERVEIRYSAPAPEAVKMKGVDLPANILTSADPAAAALTRVAHAVNANAAILNSLMFTHLDYAAVGYRA